MFYFFSRISLLLPPNILYSSFNGCNNLCETNFGEVVYQSQSCSKLHIHKIAGSISSSYRKGSCLSSSSSRRLSKSKQAALTLALAHLNISCSQFIFTKNMNQYFSVPCVTGEGVFILPVGCLNRKWCLHGCGVKEAGGDRKTSRLHPQEDFCLLCKLLPVQACPLANFSTGVHNKVL